MASLFSRFASLFSRFRLGFLNLIQEDSGAKSYDVEAEILPVFVNASMQLTYLSERFSQQAIYFENEDDTTPELVPWFYRSAAGTLQALASYYNTLVADISASDATTMSTEDVECRVSSVVDFMFQNTFPNLITLTKTFVGVTEAWVPNDAGVATPVASLESSLQNLYPSGENFQCLASDMVSAGSLILTSDVYSSLNALLITG